MNLTQAKWLNLFKALRTLVPFGLFLAGVALTQPLLTVLGGVLMACNAWSNALIATLKAPYMHWLKSKIVADAPTILGTERNASGMSISSSAMQGVLVLTTVVAPLIGMGGAIILHVRWYMGAFWVFALYSVTYILRDTPRFLRRLGFSTREAEETLRKREHQHTKSTQKSCRHHGPKCSHASHQQSAFQHFVTQQQRRR